ncbi:MAG: hypothetical protein KBD27_01385 [Candidatus Moranbacteria bacterium]|nr:hypothetical protein [Candidatus Moranbacteria bacterium]
MAYSKKTGWFFGVGLLLFMGLFSFPRSAQAENLLSFTASSLDIDAGEPVTLEWEALSLDWGPCTASASVGSDFSGWRNGIGSQTLRPAVTTTYTLRCEFGSDNPPSITRSRTVTVAAVPIPTISLSAVANPLPFGGSGTITLSIANGPVATCTLSGGGMTVSGAWAGYTPPSWNIASLTLAASPPATLIWTATCTDPLGRSTGAKSVTWTVAPPPAAAATLTLNGIAGGVTISPGQDAVLRWGSIGAVSCTASSVDGAFNGPVATSGEVTVSPTTTTSYSVYCTDAAGTRSPSVLRTVTVTGDVPVIGTLELDPSLINAGGSTKLTWSVSNATSCTASSSDGFWSGAVSNVGGSSTFFPASSTSYTLECRSASGGVASREALLVVAGVSCNNGSIEGDEACDDGLNDGGADNGSCPALCSLTCTLNDCGPANGPVVCADPDATCEASCSGNQTRVGTCGGTNVCCKVVVNAPVSGTIDVTNPIGFDTVQDSLDSILGSLQAIIAIISLIFIVIGGILYMTASGDEGRVKTAKGAITAAMIGLALGVAAPSFLKQIGDILGWGAIPGPATGKPFLEIATNVLNFLLSITGIIGIIMLVVGGLMYITSAGDEDRMDTGKKIVQYSIIGIAISLGALVIVTQLAKLFT